jgi:hypothetical protein
MLESPFDTNDLATLDKFKRNFGSLELLKYVPFENTKSCIFYSSRWPVPNLLEEYTGLETCINSTKLY